MSRSQRIVIVGFGPVASRLAEELLPEIREAAQP